jgi:hypothetical protein
MARYKKGTLPVKMMPNKPNQVVIADTDGYSSIVIGFDDKEYNELKKENSDANN